MICSVLCVWHKPGCALCCMCHLSAPALRYPTSRGSGRRSRHSAPSATAAACLHIFHIRLPAVLHQALDPLALLLCRLLKLRAAACGGSRGQGSGQQACGTTVPRCSRPEEAPTIRCLQQAGPGLTGPDCATTRLWLAIARRPNGCRLRWAGTLRGCPPVRWPARGRHTPAGMAKQSGLPQITQHELPQAT